jgi:hypothetical protein
MERPGTELSQILPCSGLLLSGGAILSKSTDLKVASLVTTVKDEGTEHKAKLKGSNSIDGYELNITISCDDIDVLKELVGSVGSSRCVTIEPVNRELSEFDNHGQD